MITKNQQKLLEFMVEGVEQAAIQYGIARTVFLNGSQDNPVTVEIRRQSMARREVGLKSRKSELTAFLEGLREDY